MNGVAYFLDGNVFFLEWGNPLLLRSTVPFGAEVVFPYVKSLVVVRLGEFTCGDSLF